MNITRQEGRAVIPGEHQDWETAEAPKLIGKDRWAVHYTAVFKYLPTNDFYRLSWHEGATELQSEAPFEYTDPKLIQVRLVQVIRDEYISVDLVL